MGELTHFILIKFPQSALETPQKSKINLISIIRQFIIEDDVKSIKWAKGITNEYYTDNFTMFPYIVIDVFAKLPEMTVI